MKAEHKEAIDRARLHGVLPSVLANELMVHDLVDAALFELRNIHSPYIKLNEGQQQEVITRITDKVKDVVSTAVAIISSRNVITIPCKMKQIQVTEKTLTVTSLVDAKDPSRHGLTDSAGHLCLLVLAPDDYAEGLDFIQPDRDQHEMPLHVGEVIEGLFDQRRQADSDSADLASFDDTLSDGEDPLYSEAVVFITETRRPSISAIQRELKIGYNRAARILEGMEQVGIVSAPDSHGAREVLRPALTQASLDRLEQADLAQAPEQFQQAQAEHEALHAQHIESTGKEFGDLSYSEAQQIVVLHGTSVTNAWLQRRIGITEDQATTLLLRLSDDDVIALETEADASIDNTYTVKAALSDLTME